MFTRNTRGHTPRAADTHADTRRALPTPTRTHAARCRHPRGHTPRAADTHADT